MAVFPDYTSQDLTGSPGGFAVAVTAGADVVAHTATVAANTFDDTVVLCGNPSGVAIQVTVKTGANAGSVINADVIEIPPLTSSYRVYEGRLSGGAVVALNADQPGARFWGWVDRRLNN